jgi:hypothetical protein
MQIFHFGPFQRLFLFFVPKLRWYLNLPKFLRPRLFNSCRSIFIRLIIGCVKPLVPGIWFIIYFIYDITLVLPALHSLWGLSKMIVSIILELSVAVLALPAFPKTWVTSGIDFIILS